MKKSIPTHPDHDDSADAKPARIREWHWVLLLVSLPFIYLLVLVLPEPFGLGLHGHNDFYGNRIWWAQCTAFFIHHGHIPMWNPLETYGVTNLSYQGTSIMYPFAWWLNAVFIHGGPWNFWAEYLHIALHMAWGLSGMYVILRRFAGISPAAAVLASSVLLVNQRFNESMQYANTIETWSWIPWMVLCLLVLSTRSQSEHGLNPRNSIAWMLGLGFSAGMCGLAGYPQLAYIGALFLAVLAVSTIRSWRGLAYLAGGGLIGLIIASPLLISLVDYLKLAPHRAGGHIEYAAQFPLTYSYITQFTKPFSIDAVASVYFPPVFFLLAGFGAFLFFKKLHWRIGLGMGLGLLLLADLSLGLSGKTFRFFYEHVPFYGGFRVQGRNNWIGLIGLAWFVGLGTQWLIQHARARDSFLGLLFLSCLYLLACFRDEPFVGASYAPYSLNPELMSMGLPLLGLLTLGIGLAVYLYLRAETLIPRVLSIATVVLLFVTAFGQYASWYQPWMAKYGKIASADGFPGGVLERTVEYENDHTRMLHPKGMNSPKHPVVVAYDSVVEPAAPFPANRFVAKHPTTLELLRWSPNRMTMRVVTEAAGPLLHLSSYSSFWKSNQGLRRGKGDFSHFKVHELKAGENVIHLAFRPYGLLSAYFLSWCCMVACGVGVLYTKGKKRWGTSVALLGVIPLIVFCLGAFNPKSLPEKALYGAELQSLDPEHRVPVTDLEF